MKLTQNILNLQALNFMRHSKLKVGVLGGTFDPAHAGHLLISMEALKFYQFDYVIWLVANQNPLKKTNRKDIFTRARQCLDFATKHHRIIVSTAENDLGYHYIYDSLSSLIKRFPNVEFSWLMGADNLANFGKWYRYQELPQLCDIIIFDRPSHMRLVNRAPLAFKSQGNLAKTQTNNIIVHRRKLCDFSSTEIRDNE
jgi:nicotinate-nucleotide adenylyltransferase